DPAAPTSTRYPQIAATITMSLADERLFCELISVSAAVLERNISTEVARRYKLAAMANTTAFAELIRGHLPELSSDGAPYFAGTTLVAIIGVWPLTQPSEAMLCVYQDPSMAALRLDFATALEEMLSILLAGGLTRWAA